MDSQATSGLFVIGMILLIIMFIPWFVAISRGIKNTLAVFFLCLFLGWTFLGWVGALIWAVVEKPKYQE